MSFVNYRTKEINCKIVYYGPGLGGKTTNLQYIYQRSSNQNRGKMVSLNNKNERTLFFDFLPLQLGNIRGYRTRLHLYTVPGQKFYEASRRLILRGVDGIIFVADSQLTQMHANKESLLDMHKNMVDLRINSKKVPIIMQWNKRDLPNISPVTELNKELNSDNHPTFEAVALRGDGVFESLKHCCKLVLSNLQSIPSLHKLPQ